MNCVRFDSLLEASITGPLALAEQAEFDAHLAECPACVVNLKHYVITTQTLQCLGAVETTEAAPPLPERLVQRILVSRAAAQQARRRGSATA
jgi:anti-sigma factor RsiW